MVPITPDYFSALGARVRKGRAFSAADSEAAPRVAIVNETLAARIWPGQDPIGKRIAQGWPERHSGWREVVGVVTDMKFEGIIEPTAMQLYMPLAQEATSEYTLIARTAADPRSIATTLQ